MAIFICGATFFCPSRKPQLRLHLYLLLVLASLTGVSVNVVVLWDSRFSILTNVFISLFQGSLRWFWKSMPIVKAWHCADLLE
jgi:hypothetical protein